MFVMSYWYVWLPVWLVTIILGSWLVTNFIKSEQKYKAKMNSLQINNVSDDQAKLVKKKPN